MGGFRLRLSGQGQGLGAGNLRTHGFQKNAEIFYRLAELLEIFVVD